MLSPPLLLVPPLPPLRAFCFFSFVDFLLDSFLSLPLLLDFSDLLPPPPGGPPASPSSGPAPPPSP
eukprot:COSAG06_NODE_37127_length_439_cov_0.552941_1_plen_65_part_01